MTKGRYYVRCPLEGGKGSDFVKVVVERSLIIFFVGCLLNMSLGLFFICTTQAHTILYLDIFNVPLTVLDGVGNIFSFFLGCQAG